jgi:hypothetical protein
VQSRLQRWAISSATQPIVERRPRIWLRSGRRVELLPGLPGGAFSARSSKRGKSHSFDGGRAGRYIGIG